MPIISTTNPDGSETFSLDAVDEWCLWVPMWIVSDRYRGHISTELDIVPVRRVPWLKAMYYARRHDAPVVHGFDIMTSYWWRLVRVAWRCGLVEAPPAAVDGRPRFRPFPWRGTMREYRD